MRIRRSKNSPGGNETGLEKKKALRDWIFSDRDLFDAVPQGSFADLAGFVAGVLGVETQVSPLIPEKLLECERSAIDAQTSMSSFESPFGDRLRMELGKIELTAIPSESGGVTILPLGVLTGMDEVSMRSRMETLAKKYTGATK